MVDYHDEGAGTNLFYPAPGQIVQRRGNIYMNASLILEFGGDEVAWRQATAVFSFESFAEHGTCPGQYPQWLLERRYAPGWPFQRAVSGSRLSVQLPISAPPKP